jgi:YebC/PmpR family DNA-binding regulatory protein
MSGHSKWSTIKHKKAATDAKKGATFTKLGRLIEVAAKGGPDPEMNFRLKLAVSKAREANMPAANIDKAIRKGAGLDADKSQIEEITYEGVGPGNVAFMIETLTDNKNRSVSDLRTIFTKGGGTLGNSGSVAWQFANRGLLTVKKKSPDDELTIIDAGALDLTDVGDAWEVQTEAKDLNAVKTALTNAGMNVEDAKLAMVPTNMVKISDIAVARKVMALIDNIEDNEDVSQVFTNFDIDESIAEDL